MTDLRYRNKLEIDVDGSLITPTIVLCTRSGKKIGVLQNVQGLKRSHPMNDVAEMSFDVYKYADGKKEPCWDSIKNFKLICLPSEPENKYKWYEITVNIDETTDTIKHITAIHANEAELGQLMLYEVEINTEDDINRDDYETITIGEKEYGTVFYNPEHPNNSLLHRILADKASHYQIIHVDDTLKNIQREFSFNGVSIADALNQTIAQEIQCLFVFGESLNKQETNDFQRTISAYDLLDYCEDCGERGSYSQGVCTHCGSTHIKSGYGKDTGIFINTENLTDSISFTSATDQVKNFFRMSAGDEDMTTAIRNCNPNGSAYLVYFSKEMQEDMSDELRARLNEYNTIYDSYLKTKVITLPSSDIDAYNNLINKYQKYSKEELPLLTSEIQGFNVLTNYDYNAVNFRDFLQTVMMPRSSEVVDTTAEEQIGLLTVDNMSPIGVEDYTAMSLTASNTAVKNYAKVYVDTSLYRIDISDSTYSNNEWSGTITLTSYTDEEDTASINLNIIFNNDGAVFLKQKIEKAMTQHKTEDIGDVSFLQKDISQIKSELVKYSLDSLSLLDDICSSVMDILAQAGQGEADSPYYSEFYYPYWQKRNAIMEEESVRENEIAVIEKVIEDIDSTRTDIINYLNMESFFGDLYPELMLYRRETEYSNTNFISDGLTDSEIIEKAQEFFKRAQEEIIKASTVQHSISGNLYNLFLIPEFRQIVKDDSSISNQIFNNKAVEKFLRTFESGNWLRVRVDDEIYKLRMTNWEIDYDSPEQLDVEFSDVVYGNGTMSDIASLLSQARSMASSYNTVMRQAEKGNEANSSINKTKKQGLLLNQNKIISDINEQSFVIDSNGALMRAKNDFDDGYSNEQVKLLNKGIYYTNDSWETVKAGLGHFMYYDPETGTTKEDYGIIASTIVGQLLLGENLKIYSESNKLEMDDDGLVITARDGKDNEDLFAVQKDTGEVDEDGKPIIEKYIYVNKDGNINITGNSIIINGANDSYKLDDARRVASNYMSADSTGIMIADMRYGAHNPSDPEGRNILLTDDALQVRDGQDVLASYGEITTIGKESSNHIKIDQYGVDIKDGDDSLASYGETVRIGQETLPHLELGSGGMTAYKNKTDKYYEIGDGSSDAVQRYIVLELPLILNLSHPIESVTNVSINDTVLNADQYEWASDDQEITILDRPVGAIKIDVTYTYVTSEEDEETSEGDEQTVTSITDTFNIDAAPSLEIEMDYRIISGGNVTVSQVLIDDAVLASDKYTIDTTVLEINERPTSGSTVTIQYHFKEQSPYFTFNKRKSGVDKGNSSVSFGNESSASGDSSFATGIETSASGHGSFVGGNKSVASGAFSGAIGEGTTASGIGSFACGRYNVESSTHLFSVGNGTEKSPSDAFYVSAGGSATLYGDLQVKKRALIHGQMRGGIKNGGYIAMFSTKSFYKTVGSISANGASTGVTLNITRNGYYPMAVSGIRILNKTGGSGASRCNVYIYKIVNNTNESHITFSIANLGSANATGVKVEFTVFYIARNAVLGE